MSIEASLALISGVHRNPTQNGADETGMVPPAPLGH